MPFYGRFQHRFLKLYMLLIKLVRLPLLGRLVRWIANTYGKNQHGGYLITLDEAQQIVDISKSIYLGPCSCRSVFHNCDLPVMSEIVISAGEEVYHSRKKEKLEKISKEEALQVLQRNHKANTIHTIMHCQGMFYAICSCCPCCCVPYRLKKDYNIEYALVRNKNIVEEYRQQLLEREK